MKMSAEKVMVTILVNDSWKNIIVPSIMTTPYSQRKKIREENIQIGVLTWKTDLKNQIRKVFTESDLPFCNVA